MNSPGSDNRSDSTLDFLRQQASTGASGLLHASFGSSAVGTIVASATPPGRGGVAILRLSGPDAFDVASALTHRSAIAVRKPKLVDFFDALGREIDRGLLLAFHAPHSFTGEDVVELHAHGSPVVMDMLLEAALAAGARLAKPGEFSLRAYLAGKLDLAQAEAVADLIHSGTRAMARAAAGSLQGAFSRAVLEIKADVIRTRVHVEAAIDFPEEGIDPLADLNISARVGQHLADLEALLQNATNSLQLRDGLRVVLAGKPNAGKSSLLNALSGRDSAIVTALPGTTRDIVREQLDLDGASIEVLDTAGLREPRDPVEAEGVRRARVAFDQADVLLLVVDGAAERERAPDTLLEAHDFMPELWRARALIVINKVDLTQEAGGTDAVEPIGGVVRVSTLTGAGVPSLRALLRRRVGADHLETPFLARRRHVDALERTRGALARALALVGVAAGLELVAEELRQVQQTLGEVVGDVSSDELLGTIFSAFCIGK